MSTTRPTAPTSAAVPPQEMRSSEHHQPASTSTVLADAETRGSTTIADRVVERMAAAASGEIEQGGGSKRRLLGVPAGRHDAGRPPLVHARVHGSVATIAVRLSVAYPASVPTVTEQVRTRIIDRLAELAGIRARTVDITVTALPLPHTHGRVIA